MENYGCTATYSPDDNKLRLYAATRLSKEDYDRVKAAGFRWAPKQDLFFATWSPSAEDAALAFAGEIDDEDKSLSERAEERSDRFETYSEKRLAEAQGVKRSVDRIADGIPFGQPILVGHHSERRARKDAARIQNGMAKAVKLWETSEYWQSRAAGALRHAKYKELPSVRARRIKTLEADLRRQQRIIAASETALKLWNSPAKELTLERAKALANFSHVSMCFTLAEFPRQQPVSTYEGERSVWSALDAGIVTAQQAKEIVIPAETRTIERAQRWASHYKNRLTYERAMLGEVGGIATDQKKPEKGGACRCWASHRGGYSYIVKVNKVSVSVADNWGNGGKNFLRIMPFDKISMLITADEVQTKRDAGLLVEFDDKTGFMLRDTPPPEPRKPQEPDATAKEFLALKDQAKQRIEVVTVAQLFVTPKELAERVVDAADIRPGQRILEPSAGTGALLLPLDTALAAQNSASGEAISGAADKVAVEINPKLAEGLLRLGVSGLHVHQGDFLQCNGDLGKFDRVIMNPPFADQADIDHVTHALNFLKPGGKLVAIMSAGVRFRQDRKASEFRALIDAMGGTIEKLPEDSFKQTGTTVRTVLVEVSAT